MTLALDSRPSTVKNLQALDRVADMVRSRRERIDGVAKHGRSINHMRPIECGKHPLTRSTSESRTIRIDHRARASRHRVKPGRLVMGKGRRSQQQWHEERETSHDWAPVRFRGSTFVTAKQFMLPRLPLAIILRPGRREGIRTAGGFRSWGADKAIENRVVIGAGFCACTNRMVQRTTKPAIPGIKTIAEVAESRTRSGQIERRQATLHSSLSHLIAELIELSVEGAVIGFSVNGQRTTISVWNHNRPECALVSARGVLGVRDARNGGENTVRQQQSANPSHVESPNSSTRSHALPRLQSPHEEKDAERRRRRSQQSVGTSGNEHDRILKSSTRRTEDLINTLLLNPATVSLGIVDTLLAENTPQG